MDYQLCLKILILVQALWAKFPDQDQYCTLGVCISLSCLEVIELPGWVLMSVVAISQWWSTDILMIDSACFGRWSAALPMIDHQPAMHGFCAMAPTDLMATKRSGEVLFDCSWDNAYEIISHSPAGARYIQATCQPFWDLTVARTSLTIGLD